MLASARTSASIGMLIAGALVFNYVVTIENIPKDLRALLTAWELSPAGFLILVKILLLLMGGALEGATILLIFLPVLIPTAQAPGSDMVLCRVRAMVRLVIALYPLSYARSEERSVGKGCIS